MCLVCNDFAHELLDGTYVFGWHPECDVVAVSEDVWEGYCTLVVEGTEAYIEDLGNVGGAFVNGKAIDRRTPLTEGDEIVVGGATYTFERRREPRNEQSAKAASKLDAVINMTQAVAGAMTLDAVLAKVLDSIFEIFPQASRGFIALLDDSEKLVPRGIKQHPDDNIDAIFGERGLYREVMDTKEAILSADVHKDWEETDSIADFRLWSVMLAPLIGSGDAAFGMLRIDTLDQRRRFREPDLEVLVVMVAQAALAIDDVIQGAAAIEQATAERDRELAREVLWAFLPQSDPDFGNYKFASSYVAANHFGGDFFDYIQLPNGRLAIVIADVAGFSGVVTAMLMAKMSAETRFTLACEPHPASAVTAMNRRLCEMKVDRFVTLSMAAIDSTTEEVTFVNAGSLRPVHRRIDGTVEEPGEDTLGLPLGIVDDAEYQQTTFLLKPGELLIMLTDGIYNATNRLGEPFTKDHLRQVIEATDGPPEAMVQAITDALREHCGATQQPDDACLLCFGPRL